MAFESVSAGSKGAQVIQFPAQPSRAELWAELMMLGQRMGRERCEEDREHWLEFFGRIDAIGSSATFAELHEKISAKRDQLREYAKGVLDEVGWD